MLKNCKREKNRKTVKNCKREKNMQLKKFFEYMLQVLIVTLWVNLGVNAEQQCNDWVCNRYSKSRMDKEFWECVGQNEAYIENSLGCKYCTISNNGLCHCGTSSDCSRKLFLSLLTALIFIAIIVGFITMALDNCRKNYPIIVQLPENDENAATNTEGNKSTKPRDP